LDLFFLLNILGSFPNKLLNPDKNISFETDGEKFHINLFCIQYQKTNSVNFLILFSVRGHALITLAHKTKRYILYNPIAAMGFLAMFTFQLDNTKR
jgi:hypothetical protein